MNMLVQSFESWDAHLYTRLTTLKCLVYVQKQAAAAFSFGHTLFESRKSSILEFISLPDIVKITGQTKFDSRSVIFLDDLVSIWINESKIEGILSD